MRSYKKLRLWSKSDGIAKEIYRVSAKFPRSEMYGLTSQLRRAILSIPLNIVEGYARDSKKSFKNFLAIAYSSLIESEYLIEFAHELEYIRTDKYNKIIEDLDELGRMIWAYRKKIGS